MKQFLKKTIYEGYISPRLNRPKGLLPRLSDAPVEEVSRYQVIYPGHDDYLLLDQKGLMGDFNYPFTEENGVQGDFYVAVLPRGIVNKLGHTNFAVLTNKKRVVLEQTWVSEEQERKDIWKKKPIEEHPVFVEGRLPHRHHYEGQVAVLAHTLNTKGNFYHWCYDLLPRLHLLQQAGVDLQACRYYMHSPDAAFEKATLERFGIRAEQIIDMRYRPLISADELILTQYPCIGREYYQYWALAFLRDFFLPSVCPSDRVAGKPLFYISRNDGTTRRIENEDELFRALEPLGFSFVTMSGFSLEEQSWLFHQADVIISGHGAAFSHLPVCRTGTKVVEIFPKRFVIPWFAELALRLKLDYRYFITEGVEKHPMKPIRDDIRVDVEAFLRFLNQDVL